MNVETAVELTSIDILTPLGRMPGFCKRLYIWMSVLAAEFQVNPFSPDDKVGVAPYMATPKIVEQPNSVLNVLILFDLTQVGAKATPATSVKPGERE